MKKMSLFTLRSVLFAVALIVVPSILYAQQAEKIGFFTMEEALATSDVGKAWNDEFKKNYDKSKQTIQDAEKELQKLKDELDKQRPFLKEQALKDKETAYQKKFRTYQELVKDSNDDLNTRRQDLFNKYVPEILKIVNRIGEKDRYTMIIDLSSVPLAYHKKESNITKRIIDELNKQTAQPKK